MTKEHEAHLRRIAAREREERKKPWPKPDLVMSREAMRDLHADASAPASVDWVIRQTPDIDWPDTQDMFRDIRRSMGVGE